MREIKFRAWDKKDPMMITAEKHYVSFGGRMTANDGSDCTDNYIIMQYTGFKDKDEKEIFEDDIIMKRPFNSTQRCKYVVMWKNGGWYACVAVETDGYLSHYPDESSGEWLVNNHEPTELIGNKHENPEILK